jgi:hypothetical protein
MDEHERVKASERGDEGESAWKLQLAGLCRSSSSPPVAATMSFAI